LSNHFNLASVHHEFTIILVPFTTIHHHSCAIYLAVNQSRFPVEVQVWV
jgi:hypothetical protein